MGKVGIRCDGWSSCETDLTVMWEGGLSVLSVTVQFPVLHLRFVFHSHPS